MTIQEVYDQNKIMPSLQMHMLRVAAVASIICENINSKVAKEEIIKACLVHDIANIVKFNMNIMPEFFEPEGVEYWSKVQQEFKEKYGTDDHVANVNMVKELGLEPEIVEIVEAVDFSSWCEHARGTDLRKKIAMYSDGRVAPFGIKSFNERMEEARPRYIHLNYNKEKERQEKIDAGKEVEKEIFSMCKIRPEDINDQAVAPIIPKLRNYVIK